MSLCLRTFPNKFASIANTRKRITKIDRQLPKHVKSSVFLEEFLDAPTTTCTTNLTARSTNCETPLLSHNLSSTLLDFRTEVLQERKQKYTSMLNGIDFNTTKDPVLNELQWFESTQDFNYLCKNKIALSDSEMLWINRILDGTMVNCEMQRILYTEANPSVKSTDEKPSPGDHKPSDDQLQSAYDSLSKELRLLFIKPMNHELYTKDIVFINNIRGVTTKGLEQYVKQVALLKIVGHLKFAYVKLDILKMTLHPEDSSIKIRWRIVGVSGTKVFFMFWKFKAWDIKDHIDSQASWYDGFSTFYVNNEGKIYKHVVDKLMPDEDSSYKKVKTPVTAKLAALTPLLGLDSYSFIRTD